MKERTKIFYRIIKMSQKYDPVGTVTLLVRDVV